MAHISIILPAHNCEEFIGACLSSVLAQTLIDFEIILVNDGSKDNSKRNMLSFNDHRIRYFEQNNQGVSAARNLGLLKMRGDFFCFLDADDFLPPNSLESRIKVFEDHPELSFVDGRVRKFSAEMSTEVGSWTPTFSGNPLTDLLALSGKSFFGPTWMIKRKPGNEYRFKEGLTHGEDLLFFIELARDGGLYGYTEETVLHYRTGHQSAMKNLIGLEQGYRSVYHEIHHMHDIPEYLKKSFRKKSKSIMMKSHLGKGRIKDACRIWMDRDW